jgi:8-oxo-dGTP diphosphatase
MSDRMYPRRPILGVGVIVVGRTGVLLARRDKDPGEGLWSIPGGGVELGETQEEAAVRETKEETGVDCDVIEYVGTADLVTKDSSGRVQYHFILNHFLARALTYETQPELPSGEVDWFHPDRLPPDMVDKRVTDLILSLRDRIIDLMGK